MENKVDIWAIGMIMYEILTKGGHPMLGDNFYHSLDMSVEEFKGIMLSADNKFKIMKVNNDLSILAMRLLENMLNSNPNNRYDAQVALKHPWITRDKNGIIPLSMYEEMQMNIMAYDKLKLVQRVAYAMSILNDKVIKKNQKIEIGKKNLNDEHHFYLKYLLKAGLKLYKYYFLKYEKTKFTSYAFY